MSLIKERHDLIIQWIEEAAEDIKKGIKSTVNVEQKTAKNDLVTNLDKQTEKNLVEKIREHFPDDKIVSEEGFGDDLKDLSGRVWFVDPIDGTLNFVKQNDNYAVMLAVYEDGAGIQSYIYNVERDELYYAIKGEGAYLNNKGIEPIKDRNIDEGLLACNSASITKIDDPIFKQLIQKSLGIRMIGSAGLEAADVATSKTVAYIATNLKPWDIAPGKIIVEELGGVVSKVNGEEIDLLVPSPSLFANKEAHKEIVEKLGRM